VIGEKREKASAFARKSRLGGDGGKKKRERKKSFQSIALGQKRLGFGRAQREKKRQVEKAH